MADLFDQILRIAQKGHTTTFGADWSPLYDKATAYGGIVYPENKEDDRLVYAYVYEYAKHGVHPNQEEEEALFAEKRILAEHVRKLNEQQSLYVYRADYCEMKPIRENGVNKGYDIIFRCKSYITLEEYQEKYPERMKQILYDTSEEAEQKRIAFVEELLFRLCLALKECHELGAVHGHVTPKNIWLCAAEADKEAFRLGFPGIGAFSGTKADDRLMLDEFSAPELNEDEEQSFDEQTDLYSLGVTLYCMLNEGKMPFAAQAADSKEEIQIRWSGMCEIPDPKHGSQLLRYIVRKLLAHRRSCRYQTAAELEQDIKRRNHKVDDVHAMDVVTVSQKKLDADLEQEQEKLRQEKAVKQAAETERKTDEAAAAKAGKGGRKQFVPPQPPVQAAQLMKETKEAIDQRYAQLFAQIQNETQNTQPQQDRPAQSAPQPNGSGGNDKVFKDFADQETLNVPEKPKKKGGCGCVVLVLVLIALIAGTIYLVNQLKASGRKLMEEDVDSSQITVLESQETDHKETETEMKADSATETTEALTEAPTEAPTEPPTEAPTGYKAVGADSIMSATESGTDVEERYTFVSGKYTWEEAEQYCEARGGHLATIHSEADWNAILNTVKTAQKSNAELKYIWLGATSSLNDDMEVFFSWVDNSNTDYIMSADAYWYYNEKIGVREPSGYDAYEYVMNGKLIREPYLLLWNVAPKGGSSSEWSLNDVPDVSDYSMYKSSNMGFVMEMD